MPSRSVLLVLGGGLFVVGLILCLVGYIKYTNFVVMANRLDANLADKLTYENTDGMSEKNAHINGYLWSREYRSLNNPELTRLGDQCRFYALPSVLCCFIGLALLAISSS